MKCCSKRAPPRPVDALKELLVLEELEKVASEEGIDLDELSDDDIVEIMSEVMGGQFHGETSAAAGGTVHSAGARGYRLCRTYL